MRDRLIYLVLLIACTALLHGAHPTGLLRLPEEELRLIRDTVPEYAFENTCPTRGGDTLPASVQNLEHLPVVGSQGSMGICGSFAPSYYLFNYYISKRDGDGQYAPSKDAARMCSPMWAVHSVPHGGRSQPDGANSLSTIQKLVSCGYLTWEEMPFDGPHAKYYSPDAEAQLTALARKGGNAIRLSNIQDEEGLQNLKKALANGDIFVASTAQITKNFDNYPNTNDAEPNSVNGSGNIFAWPSSLRTSDVRPPHAVTIVGYDDTRKYVSKDGKACSGALLAVNSWGTGWGNGGFIWIGYDAVLTHHFLEGEVYTMKITDGNYVPESTAVVTLSDGDGNWLESVTGAFWSTLMTFSLNGYSVENPANGSAYMSGMEKDELTVELLLDLTGHDDIRFQQLDISCAVLNNLPLGTLDSVKFLNAIGQSVRIREINEIIKALPSLPVFEYTVSCLDQLKGVMPDIYPYRCSMQVGDLNGDGSQDLVLFGYQADDNGRQEVIKAAFLQNPNGSWTRKNLDAMDLEDQCTLALTELTQDGFPELAVTNGTDLLLLKNNGKGEFSKLATVSIASGGNFHGSFLKTADFDNDGKLDFLMMDSNRIIIVRQVSATEYTVLPISNLSNNIWFDRVGDCLDVGDLNGDGWLDIVAEVDIKSTGNRKYVLLVNKGDFTFEPHLLPLPAYTHSSIAIADANGDGCDDILCAGGTSYDSIAEGTLEECKIFICHGQPNAGGKVQLPRFATIDSAFVPNWGGNVLWADMDLDGRLEAVVTGTTNPAPYRSIGGSPYEASYVNSMAGRLHDAHNNYLKILQWDGKAYVDSKLQMPGTVGHWTPSPLFSCDFNHDGKPDIIHAGALGAKSLTSATPNHNAAAIIYLQNELDRTSHAPAVPVGLSTKVLGSGKVQFTWKDATDDTTSAGGLRYVLRVGTASGKGDVLNEQTCHPCRSGIILTHLPNKKLFWAVRTVDAGGLCSSWSSEATVTPTGTTSKPAVQTTFPEPAALPEATPAVVNANPEGGTVTEPQTAAVGSTISLSAKASSGYRFSHWEGDVLQPLNRNSEAVILEDSTYTAHFVPDYSTLQMDENCLGYLDSQKNLWYYTAPGKKEIPQTSASSGSSFFALARDTAYFSKIGPRELPDWFWCTSFPYTADWAGTGRQQLLRAVSKDLWHTSVGSFGDEDGYGGYPELTERAWGGPGGLAVLYQAWQTASYHKRRVYLRPSANFGNYSVSFTIEKENADNDPIECVPQRDFFLMLTTSGQVKAMGSNTNGVFGVSTPASSNQFIKVPGLPTIQSIAAGEGFAAAIDVNGNLWTWGSNSHGQLGRGSQGNTYPEPERVTGLSVRIVSIAAGSRHLLAMDEKGRLHAWGDNSKGQLGADDGLPLAGIQCLRMAAAGTHSCAIAADGNLYYWGNGEHHPEVLDNVNFTPVAFTLDVDERVAALLPHPAGTFICRAGQTFSLKAESSENVTFSHWLLNGERVQENPISFTPSGTFTLKPVYSFPKPMISFGEPTVNPFRTTIPVQISNTETSYDGLSFSLQYTKNLQLLGMEFEYPTPLKRLLYQTGELSEPMQAAEFYIYGNQDVSNPNLFNRNPVKDGPPVLMLRLIFANSTEGGEATVSFNGIPKLSRSLGQFSEEADTGAAMSFAMNPRKDYLPRTIRPDCVSDGGICYLFIPGEPQISTIEELAERLGVESVSVWAWDGKGFSYSNELKGQQPLLMKATGTFNGSGIPYVQAQQKQIELAIGWNLVMVQQEITVPENTAGVFRLDLKNKTYVRHSGVLQPGEIYWLFRN